MLNFFKKKDKEPEPKAPAEEERPAPDPELQSNPAPHQMNPKPSLDSGAPDSGDDAPPPGNVKEMCVEALKNVYDPEIPVNIWEMGLIYDIRPEDNGEVYIKMTLTSPNCPAAEEIPQDVKRNVGMIPGVQEVKVEIVWEPTWDPHTMMSDVAKLELGME